MTITIEHINEDAVKRLINECSIKVIDSCERMTEDLLTITLNDNALLRTYGNGLIIDLAGEICFISEADYFSIMIE